MNRTLWIILLLLWILLGLWLCNKYICDGTVASSAKTTQKVTPAITKPTAETIAPWLVKDGSAFSFTSPDHISFSKSSFSRLNMADGLKNKLSSLVTYLKGHPERGLTIVGRYGSEEKNRSILPTLGLARANDVKTWLQSQGVASGQLEIADKLISNIKYNGNKLTHGVDFNFDTIKKGNDRIDAIKARLKGKPITLYFATDQDNIDLTAQQRKDFADLNYYLDRVPAAKLNISGHTDNVGNRDYNINLSQQRAVFVRDYITRNGGVNSTRMSTKGYGPDRPVANNTTTEGKAKNRRVEVTLN